MSLAWALPVDGLASGMPDGGGLLFFRDGGG